MFHVCNIIFLFLNTPQCAHHQKNYFSSVTILVTPFTYHPTPMPCSFPLITIILFCISVCLSLFHLICSFILFLFVYYQESFVFHMSEIIQYWSFFISLRITSRFLSLTYEALYELALGYFSDLISYFYPSNYLHFTQVAFLMFLRYSLDPLHLLFPFCQISLPFELLWWLRS